jgi:hypothetical protein
VQGSAAAWKRKAGSIGIASESLKSYKWCEEENSTRFFWGPARENIVSALVNSKRERCERLKDQLFKRSADAVQRAIRHYLDGEYDQFLIHAGHSFELVGKARLAAIHPSLIVDRDFDSFLHVCAASKHAKRPPWNIKTITATEVLTRCVQLHPALNDFSARLRLLAEYRNSAIHLGEIIEEERKQIFHTIIASTCLIIDEMEIKRREFFGEFEELVTTHLDVSVAEVNREVAERLARSKAMFKRRYSALNDAEMQVVAKSVEARYPVDKYERTLIDCPACGMQGLISGSYDVDWQVDYDRDGSISGGYPIVTMTASGFDCAFCDLRLDNATELKASGLPMTVDIEDVDPADFYEGPGY